jgi:hypothetical protein
MRSIERSPIHSGTLPDRLFLLKSNDSNILQFCRDEGICPLKLLLLMCNTLSLFNFPSSTGICPSKLFLLHSIPSEKSNYRSGKAGTHVDYCLKDPELLDSLSDYKCKKESARRVYSMLNIGKPKTSTSCRFLRGSGPVMLVYPRSSTVSERRRTNDFGILPFNVLLFRCSSVRDDRFPIEDGMEPYKLLFDMWKRVRFSICLKNQRNVARYFII